MDEMNKVDLISTLESNQSSIIGDYSRSPLVLRFGRTYIGISDIENQYYCEQKLHLAKSKLIQSSITSVQQKPVTEQTAEEKLLVSDVLKSQIREDIGNEGHNLISCAENELKEVRVSCVFKDILILGRFDKLVIDSSNNSLIVVENKFREQASIPKDYVDRNGVTKCNPYLEHCTQARVYSYSLRYMLESTFYSNYETDYIIRYYLKGQEDCLPEKPVKEFFYRYTPSENLHCIDELNFVIGYWLEKRDPIPTKSKAKGLDCIYKPFCNKCFWAMGI